MSATPDSKVMTCCVTMSASHADMDQNPDFMYDRSLESEVRKANWLPRSGFELTTPYIVAATDRLQAFRFPQSSRQGVVENVTCVLRHGVSG